MNDVRKDMENENRKGEKGKTFLRNLKMTTTQHYLLKFIKP